MSSRVLITGASGNLGSRLVEALTARHDLTLIDLVGENHRADLSELGDWTSLFDGQDVVVHLAGDRRPEATWAEVLESNVTATLNVYRAAAEHNVTRVILASSVWAARGAWSGRPIPAEIVAPGDNAYGASKVFCEQIARWNWDVHGITTVALRIGGCPPGSAPPVRQNPWEDSCWLSPADAVSALTLAIERPVTGFHLLTVTSANPAQIWDLAPALDAIGYRPADTWAPARRGSRIPWPRRRRRPGLR